VRPDWIDPLDSRPGVSRLQRESGEVVRMAGIAEDVTQQKLAEEAVEHCSEQMSQTRDPVAPS